MDTRLVGYAALNPRGELTLAAPDDSVADELAYVIEHAGARYAVAENQEQVDKLLEIQRRGIPVDVVIYEDPRGLRHYEGLRSYAEVQKLGAQALTTDAVKSLKAGVAA